MLEDGCDLSRPASIYYYDRQRSSGVLVTPEADSRASDQTQKSPQGEPKTLASGRYVVQRLLGEGGQKTVYLIHDTALGRDCALCLIKTDLVDPDDLTRVRREAQAMAQLGAQPHIVTVFDLGEEDGRPYIVCEYVSGGDLRAVMSRNAGPLPLGRAIAIAKDVCRALAVAHKRGIVHRDIKPANVWLTEDGSAKLGDFGVATAIDRSRLTMAGTVIGTAAYMAPEQALGGEATPRTDLYSLGCLLYEMVTSRPPFVADAPMAVISQHVHAKPTPPSQHNPEIPRALDTLILKLLAKDQDERPSSAEEVLAELERAGEEVVRQPAARSQSLRFGRPLRSFAWLWANPIRLVTAILVLVAVGVGAASGLVLSWAGGGDEPDEPIVTAPATAPVTFHVDLKGPGQYVSGDCDSEDMIIQFRLRGTVTGEISGRLSSTLEATLYAAESCLVGFATTAATLTDPDGNTLSWVLEGPLSISTGAAEDTEVRAISHTPALIVTGGTGIYEGATGRGSCSFLGVVRTGEGGASFWEGVNDCEIELLTGGAATAAEPVTLQLGASSVEVALFGGFSDSPTTIVMSVLYKNTGEEPLGDLSLRLLKPAGAQILAAAKGEEQPVSAGERIWELPDLPPGDFQRFEFTLQFLASENPTVPVVVEIDGAGFESPLRSDPITIEIVQSERLRRPSRPAGLQ